MQQLATLIEQVKVQQNRVVSIAQADEREVLLAVKAAVEEKLCSFHLFGDQTKLETIAREIDLVWTERITYTHVSNVEESAQKAVQLVRDGKAHVLMKGNISSALLLKAVLNKEYGIRAGQVLSHVALFEVPNYSKLIMLSDAAMNILPSFDDKVAITNNAVSVARNIGLNKPKVAVLAAVESVNPNMQATVDAAALVEMNQKGKIQDCEVDGPFAFDIAVSKKAAEIKGISSSVAGEADILIVPTIEVGNALYKSFIYFAQAKTAAIIVGAKVPIVLTSRSDSSENKLYSLSLALVSSTID
ncbi:bifunctional enoyl-CoA hydratase/phosphate acetyltransferase [Radiobacillus kanasensis]|uniref:bifunctional enoyl-CoA hydratase/phosphate acetyltransferase n=1 Tax=Radiobacillus kanasensis TaxID=2844358 RepID=UPI001E380349|nr:bifunctional enoyl-CoA hydratase/phosphate acetyltransferase [Radiobacillus kanasensis]UFT97714.1 bifunctional enoyl-CoA hydratase/phosphate acetyltransferase [Radiobacillus kanasensis]